MERERERERERDEAMIKQYRIYDCLKNMEQSIFQLQARFKKSSFRQQSYLIHIILVILQQCTATFH